MNMSKLAKEGIHRKKLLAEARGEKFKWGNLTEEARMKGRGVVAANAATFNADIRKTCRELRLAGYDTVGALAERLNEIGVTTRRGIPFSYHNLYRVLATISFERGQQ
jgi:hypothetical protein